MVTVDTNTVGATGDYATLELWETGEAADLVAGDIIARAALQNQAHTAALTLNDAAWNTDATRYIVIEAEVSARHTGIAGSGARITYPSGTQAFAINIAEQVVIAWLELTPSTLGNSQHGVDVNVDGATVYVDKIIGHGMTNAFSTLFTGARDNTKFTVTNCIGYKMNRGIGIDGGSAVTQDWFIYNCTSWDAGLGGAAGDVPLAMNLNLPTHLVDIDIRNTALHTSVGKAIRGNTAPSANDWTDDCDKNILHDATGTAQLLKGTIKETVTFQAGTAGSGDRIMLTNLTADSEDLRLVRPTVVTDNLAIDCGDNLTALAATLPQHVTLQIDINGNTRPATGAWDVGAHQSSTGTVSTRSTLKSKPQIMVVESAAAGPADVIEVANLPASYPHASLSVQFFDGAGDPMTPSAGTVTILVEPLVGSSFEAISDNELDATGASRVKWDGNTQALRATPANLAAGGVVTWKIVATFNLT